MQALLAINALKLNQYQISKNAEVEYQAIKGFVGSARIKLRRRIETVPTMHTGNIKLISPTTYIRLPLQIIKCIAGILELDLTFVGESIKPTTSIKK